MCCTPAPIVDKAKLRLAEEYYFPYKGPGPNNGKWFTVDPKAEMPPRISGKGLAGPDCKPTTLPALFEMTVKVKGAKDALFVERNPDGSTPPQGTEALPRAKWQKWTWNQYNADMKNLAMAYMTFGFQAFDTANIWGFNSPEWFMSTLASMFAGGKCGGLYPTDTPLIAAFKVVHSGGVVCCVENQSHIEKLVTALNSEDRKDCKRLRAFISWSYTPKPGETVAIEGVGEVPVIAWKAALEKGKTSGNDVALQQRVAATKPGNCCALIYTSGTTGDPKAVMSSHDCMAYMGGAVFTTVGRSCGFATTPEEERGVSYLPLSHVAGLCTDIIGQMISGAFTPAHTAIFFARPYDLKAGTIKDRLLIARPTLFLGVPLVWEKMADKIRAVGASSQGLKKTISTWAKDKCLTHARDLQLGRSGAIPFNHCLAMRIMKAVKGAVGLDQCKYALTGAAPIRIDTLEYYGSLGIYINELYGMSESSAIVTISTDSAHQWGTVGYQLEGCEVKVFRVDPEDLNKKVECPPAPAADNTDDQYQGELCFRGRGIMMGYLACSDFGDDHIKTIEKKNAETVDADGWLHSGDKGLMTAHGLFKITGRYKELIIGEGGENIAPVPIEDSVKGICDGVNECMMIGDKRKYNVALITLKAVGANGENPGTDNLDAAAKSVSAVKTISEAMKDQAWIKYVTEGISKTNNNAKIAINNAFKIQKFMILPHNFSEEGGELTPTKKLKRAVVEKKYAAQIEKLYSTEGTYIEYSA